MIATEPLGPGTLLVVVTGEVTFSNISDLQRAVATDETNLVIDLTGVVFIDSSGLSTLITASTRVRGKVAIVVSEANPPSIFAFRGVDRLLALYPSREAALAGLS